MRELRLNPYQAGCLLKVRECVKTQTLDKNWNRLPLQECLLKDGNCLHRLPTPRSREHPKGYCSAAMSLKQDGLDQQV